MWANGTSLRKKKGQSKPGTRDGTFVACWVRENGLMRLLSIVTTVIGDQPYPASMFSAL